MGPGSPGAVLHRGSATIGVGATAVTFGVTDANGVEWVLAGIDGWEGYDTTSQLDQRAADRGAWPNHAYAAARVPTVRGTLIANSYADVSLAIDQLFAALPTTSLTTFTVDEGNGRVLQAQTRQSANKPEVTRSEGNVSVAEVSVQLECPDPLRYSTTLTSVTTGLPSTSGGLSLPVSAPVSLGATAASGRVTVLNTGNARPRPVLTVAGPTPAGTTITHAQSGRVLTVVDPVPVGRVLTIDNDLRTALLDGTAGRVVTGSFFEFTPGQNDVYFSAPTGATGTLTVAFRSAYK